jgi:hypothetical protein
MKEQTKTMLVEQLLSEEPQEAIKWKVTGYQKHKQNGLLSGAKSINGELP